MPEEMALDDYQGTCYFEADEDEFYIDDSLPGQELFKKFELLTPPQSPPHNPFPPDERTSVDKRLQMVSHILDNDPSSDSTSLPDENSFLIQDCMWSGPCLAAAGLICPSSIKNTTLCKSRTYTSESCELTSRDSCSDIQTGECVSPSAVFPAEIVRKLETVSFDLGSVGETPSPSSESEDDEEEIDVVTVVTEKLARRQHAASYKTSLHSHLAAMHNYSSASNPQASYSAPQSPQTNLTQRENHHNYAGHKRSRPTSMPASPQPIKKQRSLLHSTCSTDLKRVVKQLKLEHNATSVQIRNAASRSSSDSEGDDTNKRAQHNVLERKRRNDLKYSFLRLRDHVPELTKQERTPKVTILKLSSDFVRSLTHRNRKLEGEHARLKARHEHLRQRLAVLRRECL